jgi:hypothetical protein
MTARADPGEAYELIRASPRPDLEAAVRAAWALDTCDPVDAADWSPANPSRGQCGSTALIIHDVLGGELLIAEVVRGDGSRQGVHYWNLLPDDERPRLRRSWRCRLTMPLPADAGPGRR